MSIFDIRQVRGRKAGEVLYQVYIGNKPIGEPQKTEADAKALQTYYENLQEKPPAAEAP